MNNFLEKINASKSLKKSLADANLKVINNKKTNHVSVYISNSKKMESSLILELYNKINKKFSEMELKLEKVNFDYSFIIDKFYIYENIKEFVEFADSKINISDFFLYSEGEKFYLYVSNKILKQKLEIIKKDLHSFLKSMSIYEEDIPIKIKDEYFGKEKLLKEFNEELINNFKNEEILDETVRNKYNKINFSSLDKQTNVYFEGFTFEFGERKAKTGTQIYNFSVGNKDQAVQVTIFDKNQKGLILPKGTPVRVYGLYEFDEYKKTHVLKGFSIDSIQKMTNDTISNIKDFSSKYKRNEFHIHTKMSTLDGISNPIDYIHYAEIYGLDSITIMDHNSVQSFPDAFHASKNTKVKINYGVEIDVYDDLNTKIVINEREQKLLEAEYIFFDLETTSLSPFLDEIIEFGAVKYKNNMIIDRKQLFIKPNVEISEFTTSLTSITNDDLKNSPNISDVILEIKDWIGDSILVAHNASFDFGFLNKAFIDNGLGEIKNPIIDTVKLSWLIHPKKRSHKLGSLAKNEFVEYDQESSHRADYDAEILCKIFSRLLHKLLKDFEIRNLIDLNKQLPKLRQNIFTKHITLISKNQNGLRDINKIVSLANIDYFNSKKKIASLPLSIFFDKELFKNILIGSSCSKGILFSAILDNDEKLIESIIPIYDYFEVFPLTSYANLVSNNMMSYSGLKKVIKKILEIGEKYNIPVIASSNAHYTIPEEKVFRDIMILAQRVGGLYHPLYNFRNPNSEKPDAHLRTTNEMFEDFEKFLSKEKVYEIVIQNPSDLQNKIKKQKPLKDSLFTPTIAGSEDFLINTIKNTMKELYGDFPDERITTRLKRELDPIIKHGFLIIYYLSSIAVKKSLEQGYLVGSRGSVGSSIAATLSGITEVNPLEPHYRCPNCKYHEFVKDIDSGFDLINKKCPNCQTEMIGDGHSIPFETFLGFNADKVPDIDLNFSRENQSSIHQYMKEVLGEKNIYRAGTISTAAFKTSIGYVKRYEEITGRTLNKATIEWMASKIEGAKRTTGQHPGGLIVIPNDMEVYDFTPVNYPGDFVDAEWKTTHFDFHSIHNNLLKLDFLGHLDPSTLRMLENLTNIKPKDIPMNNKEVISLFKSNKALNYIENFTGEELGIIGLPEFGTPFVRNLVREAKPKSFSDLVRISGLSHGTNVWSGNAQKLIKEGTAVLSEVISVRDDILIYLINKGVEKSMSFNIMESVRKGNGLTEEWENSMNVHNVPSWYIESCKLIKYMFPKAHATAYVMMAYRIAWHKINNPLEYYATYFSKRDVDIEISKVVKGIPEMKKHIEELKSLSKFEKTKKDENLIETYNVIFEMYSRGIEFSNIDINLSRSKNYSINKNEKKIIPPFLILEGVGSLAAQTATKNRKNKPYESILDFRNRSSLPKKVIDLMENLNVFEGISKDINSTKQLSLFD